TPARPPSRYDPTLAMNLLLPIGLVALVAAAAWFLRGGSETTPGPSSSPPRDDVEEPEAHEDDADELELAITSDGAVFIPDGYAVRVIPLDPGEMESHTEDIEA